jgi:hypothetical protein
VGVAESVVAAFVLVLVWKKTGADSCSIVKYTYLDIFCKCIFSDCGVKFIAKIGRIAEELYAFVLLTKYH